MNRLRLKKNALNKKCALQDREMQTETRADFLDRNVRALRGFTVPKNFVFNLRTYSVIK